MARLLVSLVALSFAVPSLTAGVRIARPQITWVDTVAVNEACSAIRPVAACTILQEPTLTCECFRSGEQWRRHVQVTVTPRTYITSSSLLLHEMEHVSDFRALLHHYVDHAEARRFATAGECESSAERLRAGFQDGLSAIRDESARRRDGMGIANATSAIAPRGGRQTADAGEAGAGTPCSAAPAAAEPALEAFIINSKCP